MSVVGPMPIGGYAGLPKIERHGPTYLTKPHMCCCLGLFFSALDRDGRAGRVMRSSAVSWRSPALSESSPKTLVSEPSESHWNSWSVYACSSLSLSNRVRPRRWLALGTHFTPASIHPSTVLIGTATCSTKPTVTPCQMCVTCDARSSPRSRGFVVFGRTTGSSLRCFVDMSVDGLSDSRGIL
jgi:hypothetical protein